MLGDIDALSDDGAPPCSEQQPAEHAEETALVQSVPRKRKPDALVDAVLDSQIRQQLRHIVDSSCYCFKKSTSSARRQNCFIPFRERSMFDAALAVRLDLRKMTKEDSDKKAFRILGQRDPLTDASDERKAKGTFHFLGRRVCFGGLVTLLGLGSVRARRLRSAALKGAECPLDGRLAKVRPLVKIGLASHKRSLIFDFLTNIYLRHSEPAPECSSAGNQPEEKQLQFRRACRRGKRPRRMKKKDDSEWSPEAANALRMLPPGSYKDYLRLFHSENPDCRVSFKLFTRVWEESFSHLRIRQAGSQAMCTTCLKHKAIMKRLGSNQAALMAQSKLWGAHMKKQFSDRECYWNYRSLSRIGSDVDGQSTLTLIIDSMDHAKWSLPRTAAMAAKQFNNVVRPHMECCAVIVHGHLVCVAFAEHHIVKGADFTCELLVHVMHKLTQSGLDLRDYEVNIQSDNCTKETKNNSTCRLLAYLTSRRAIRRARMHYCMSGHSHEDIDQYFSLLGAFLGTQNELHNPRQFMDALKVYMQNESVRPNEKLRDVIKIEAVRDWMLVAVFGQA
eukprot:s2636_g12.t1